MKKQEIKEMLTLIAKGIMAIADNYDDAEETTKEEKTKKSNKAIEKTTKTTTKKVEKTKVVEEDDEEDAEYTKEDLDAMAYNDLKKLCKELGIKAVGNRTKIVDAILEQLGIDDEEEEDEEEEDIDDEDMVEEDDDDTEDEDEDEDSIYEEVVEALEDLSDEELADILSEAGLSPKGKRQALISKIVQGVEDGKIDLDFEEVEDAEDDEEEEDDESEMTEEREEAIDKFMKSTKGKDKDSKFIKKATKELKAVYDDFKEKDPKKILKAYQELKISLIDDEGDMHDLSDPYEIDGELHCCGSALQEVDGNLYCEVCGETYEIDE